MFKQNNSSSPEGTVIGSGVLLTGSLQDESSINIFGHIKGNVVSKQTVNVGPDAKVEGPIKAKNVKISGFVNGEILADELLEISSKGKVEGKIQSGVLVVHPGAYFNGNCQMENHSKPVTESIEKKQSPPQTEKRSDLEDLLPPNYEVEE